MASKAITMYTAFNIGNLTIKNRLVRSAIYEFGAEQGQITPRIKTFYQELAAGGSGLIITGMHSVAPGAGIGPAMVSAAADDYVEQMRQIAEQVHSYGSRIFVQLNHAGYRTDWRHGYDCFGVMERAVAEDCTYHAMSAAEIKAVAQAFAIAAQKCQAAGCDGVQIHAAHGFLLNTFLSPYFNQRTDDYGGAITNRARFLLMVYQHIRTAVGDDYPISVKIPFSDKVTPSITAEESIWLCQQLAAQGIDMIEVSSGITMDGGESSFTPLLNADAPEGSFLAGAAQLAASVPVPVISVCGYRTPDFIEQTLQETPVTAISLGRPLICEPDLPLRWQSDRRRAACVSCNRCYKSQGLIACQNRR